MKVLTISNLQTRAEHEQDKVPGVYSVSKHAGKAARKLLTRNNIHNYVHFIFSPIPVMFKGSGKENKYTRSWGGDKNVTWPVAMEIEFWQTRQVL